jgi:hypothetical protein
MKTESNSRSEAYIESQRSPKQNGTLEGMQQTDESRTYDALSRALRTSSGTIPTGTVRFHPSTSHHTGERPVRQQHVLSRFKSNKSVFLDTTVGDLTKNPSQEIHVIQQNRVWRQTSFYKPLSIR